MEKTTSIDVRFDKHNFNKLNPNENERIRVKTRHKSKSEYSGQR